MRLVIIPKPELSDAQNRLIIERLAAPEHTHDLGPPTVWNRFTAPNQIATLYAFIRKKDDVPIGIAESSGMPITTAGW